ncbi:CAP domain-containing protein [Bacillus timonensis]|nr:CAP domain-containing protein [Bacillus timonensis]
MRLRWSIVWTFVILSSITLLGLKGESILSTWINKEQQVSNQKEEKNNQLNDVDTFTLPDEGLYTLIGKSSRVVLEMYGEPERIDQSSYDYEWWIYNRDLHNYLQIGVLNSKIVTIYAVGKNSNINPFYIGQPKAEIESISPFASKVSLQAQSNSYRFELKEEERNTRPLLAVGEVFIQLYFDSFTEKLSSVRYMDGDTLIKLRPYELVYRGDLISAKEPTPDQWQEIEEANSAQIIDITNAIRLRHELNLVEWDSLTALVAYRHSKDMFEENYFSHTSPKYGGLKERLASENIIYQLAGENIAAQYVDGIAAVEGWLNSKGHRETLLNGEFTHLGVGVYEKYYTQNFIRKFQSVD